MLSSKKKDFFGKLLLLAATLIWGSSFIVLKDTLNKFGDGKFTFLILALRFWIAAIIVFAAAFKRLKSASKSVIIHGSVLGVILFCAYAVQTLGLKYTTPSKNAFLTVVYCVLVPFMSWLMLKKKPKIRHYVAAVTCLIGIAFVALVGKHESGSNELLGDALSLLSGVFYALQIIYISKYAENDDAIVLLFFETLVVAVLNSVVSLSCEIPFNYSKLSFGFDEIWKIAYLAVFATCFAQFAQTYGQRVVSPVSVALILSLEGVFSVLFELLTGASKMTVWIAIGFVVIFLSEIIGEVDFVNMIKKRKIKNNS